VEVILASEGRGNRGVEIAARSVALVRVAHVKCTYYSGCGRGRGGRPDHDQQHCYHFAPTVKPEAATAVVQLLMMGVRTPETY
jgi:hypothetical protein